MYDANDASLRCAYGGLLAIDNTPPFFNDQAQPTIA